MVDTIPNWVIIFFIIGLLGSPLMGINIIAVYTEKDQPIEHKIISFILFIVPVIMFLKSMFYLFNKAMGELP